MRADSGQGELSGAANGADDVGGRGEHEPGEIEEQDHLKNLPGGGGAMVPIPRLGPELPGEQPKSARGDRPGYLRNSRIPACSSKASAMHEARCSMKRSKPRRVLVSQSPEPSPSGMRWLRSAVRRARSEWAISPTSRYFRGALEPMR